MFPIIGTIPTAATARDRLLLALKRHHPEHFTAVCNLECSPREAGIRTGLIRVGGWHYGGVCDIAAASGLRERAQARLLCELFNVMAPNAQSTTTDPAMTTTGCRSRRCARWRRGLQPSAPSAAIAARSCMRCRRVVS